MEFSQGSLGIFSGTDVAKGPWSWCDGVVGDNRSILHCLWIVWLAGAGRTKASTTSTENAQKIKTSLSQSSDLCLKAESTCLKVVIHRHIWLQYNNLKSKAFLPDLLANEQDRLHYNCIGYIDNEQLSWGANDFDLKVMQTDTPLAIVLGC